jgi:hypothetical protein
MQIQSHATPNPNARKFVLPEKLFAIPQNFASVAAANAHPLAAHLFALNGVYNVFLVQDFVTVNKRPDVPWDALEEPIERIILDYLAEQKT